MFASMISSHPALTCRHEFRGTEEEFLVYGGALMQFHHVPDWAWDADVTRIHLTREYRAGAVSQLLMTTRHMVPNSVDLPLHHVRNLAEQREEMDRKLLDRVDVDLSLTYEQITGNVNTRLMPPGIGADLCALLGVIDLPLHAGGIKNNKVPRNIDECLSAA